MATRTQSCEVEECIRPGVDLRVSLDCGMEECIQPSLDLRVSLELTLPKHEHPLSAFRRARMIVP
jgi:hypothetical protein